MDEATFGQQLSALRNAARHPDSGKTPAQEKVALEAQDFLNDLQPGSARTISTGIISDLETGARGVKGDDLPMLVAILRVLRAWHGLTSLEEANALLAAANLRDLTRAEAAFIDPAWGEAAPPAGTTAAGSSADHWPPGIPDDPYVSLPLRDARLDDLTASLLADGPVRVAVIDGLGGLGKTALAVELARRLRARRDYAAVLGESARLEILAGQEIVGFGAAVLDFERLLDSLARQLGQWDITTAPLEEKIIRLSRAFQARPHLLIVDNLETSANADEIAVRLAGMLGVSRAILTSRKKVSLSPVAAMPLDGLQADDALVYLRAEAAAQQVDALLAAGEAALRHLARITGGAVLAMKLLVAQARAIDLATLLTWEQIPSGSLYRFIYYRSWQQLSEAAQKMLIYLGRAAGATVSRREIVKLGFTADDDGLTAALTELVNYSLLAVYPGRDGHRYGIHALTRQFVTGDLPEIWRGESQ